MENYVLCSDRPVFVYPFALLNRLVIQNVTILNVPEKRKATVFVHVSNQ